MIDRRAKPMPISRLPLVVGVLTVGAGLLAAAGAIPAAAGADRATIYVKAGAKRGGDGSRSAPLRSLRRVERRSRRGDRIVVLPARLGVPPLNGGIALKRRQRLVGAGRSVRRRGARRAPRITNTRPGRRSGDGVRLARGASVRNLVITGTHRGAIYGRNVGRVRIVGNEVSHHNRSCSEGFHIPPFQVPTTVPGAGIPISAGLANGWAAIMVDASRGRRRLTIARNRVHSADCGDGIDVRLSGRARARARIVRNVVRGLRQGEELESVLAIGLQTVDRSRLRARLHRNRQADLGNEEDPGLYVLGADSEGIFANLDGAGRMRVRVTRNTYTNEDGIGGFSANGMELVNMGDDGARARMTIADSSFTGPPGDILEMLNFGLGGDLGLILRRVIASRSVGQGNTLVIPGNNGDCLLVGNGAAGGRLAATVRDSELSDCSNNGITFGSNVVEGSGPAGRLSLDLARSDVTGNRGSNLLVGGFNDISELDVAIADTDLSDSEGGPGIGLANAAFESLGETERARIDLGGGPFASAGGNCLAGGVLAANLVGLDVAAEGNWWGAPGEPAPGRVVAVGGTLDAAPALSAPPPCGVG